MSVSVPLMTGIALSQKPRTPTSGGNPSSYVQADGRNNTSFVMPNWEPWPNLGPDSCDLGTLVN